MLCYHHCITILISMCFHPFSIIFHPTAPVPWWLPHRHLQLILHCHAPPWFHLFLNHNHSPARHSPVTIPPTLIPNSHNNSQRIGCRATRIHNSIFLNMSNIYFRDGGQGLGRVWGIQANGNWGTFIITVRYDELQGCLIRWECELCEVPSPAGASSSWDIVVYWFTLCCVGTYLCNLNTPPETVGVHSSLCAFTICTPGMCIYYYHTIECAFTICTPVPEPHLGDLASSTTSLSSQIVAGLPSKRHSVIRWSGVPIQGGEVARDSPRFQ